MTASTFVHFHRACPLRSRSVLRHRCILLAKAPASNFMLFGIITAIVSVVIAGFGVNVMLPLYGSFARNLELRSSPGRTGNNKTQNGKPGSPSGTGAACPARASHPGSAPPIPPPPHPLADKTRKAGNAELRHRRVRIKPFTKKFSSSPAATCRSLSVCSVPHYVRLVWRSLSTFAASVIDVDPHRLCPRRQQAGNNSPCRGVTWTR